MEARHLRFPLFFGSLVVNGSRAVQFEKRPPRVHVRMEKLQHLLCGHLLAVFLVLADHGHFPLAHSHLELVQLSASGRVQVDVNARIPKSIVPERRKDGFERLCFQIKISLIFSYLWRQVTNMAYGDGSLIRLQRSVTRLSSIRMSSKY